ncbi:type I polyketide synthase [Kutzneria kofuensis]|uniref:Acyl transferase domain-containing protein n=1 Tax=Kutzneria kofuensis TaxID=103725 RepID=A0A7W9NL35_9PSEU|nr:type I polyketide synthase [Kutzneria kofuensis]MBB5896349.1 acyl transferase domain-containing protein [Kutzneria kofuensis]
MSAAFDQPIAVVGAALRLPGARNLGEYWDLLTGARDTVTRRTDAVPDPAASSLGVPPDARFVGAYGGIDDPMAFDPARFGMSAAEALQTDPQQRVLLELVDEALHVASVPAAAHARTGVFAGAGLNSYADSVRTALRGAIGVDDFAVELGTARDYLAGKIAYRLNLRGPVVNVLAACSTGLVAVHLASRALLDDEVDVAVAGVSAIRYPLWTGYWAVPGSIASADGVCRPFDVRATGTVPADGAGAVVLKRLADAVSDGDDVLAVVRGSAVGNDGRKPGFGHVRADAQEDVIRAALRAAGVEPGDVSYVEAHGTGTRLGDAVEWSTLHRVFGANAGSVAVGTSKGSLGHTREAAGMAGLLKAILCLSNGVVPPSANFGALPHDLRLESALLPVTDPIAVERGLGGVSAFGLGGTNCHVVLERAPRPAARPAARRSVALVSSHSVAGLDEETRLLRDAGAAQDDLAAGSQVRAHHHQFRRFVELSADLGPKALARRTRKAPRRATAAAFAFPGVGSDHIGMVADLAAASELFRASLRDTAELARAVGVPGLFAELPAESPVDSPPTRAGALVNLRMVLGRGAPPQSCGFTSLPVRHLSLFAVQLAFVDLLASAGVRPAAVVGHSLGEWTAATVVGAISRADAVRMVARRAELIQSAPQGMTVSVAAGAEEIRPLLDDGLEIAAENSPVACVVSGIDATAFEERLRARGVVHRRLDDRFAFHNRLLAEAADTLAGLVEEVEFTEPAIPMASAVTGEWVKQFDAAYWRAQLIGTVRFKDALATLARDHGLLVEIGPGNVRPWATHAAPDLDTVRTAKSSFEGARDRDVYEQALAELWLHGHEPVWPVPAADRPHRAPRALPPVLTRRGFDPGREHEAVPAAPAAEFPLRAASELSQRLAELWCALLGLDHVDEDDHFFDLGGDSLLGRHLIALVRQHTGREVPGEVVFASGTVRGMADSIQRHLSEGTR